MQSSSTQVNNGSGKSGSQPSQQMDGFDLPKTTCRERGEAPSVRVTRWKGSLTGWKFSFTCED